ncbi:oligosaccharide flippase family protein [Chryseobacterium sp. CFS15]|uniref:lipopolysaccharide biosynthesis protein n=1 Tax=Chryseobacterium sp. CFS15 TaxID=2986946 RepID=UPI00280895BA|nr:oligosaccharide flippase family protein [Chryseobacterium sp. CFS15]MDQ8144325.1 oligosaccharide flippase family protein [Chryseobacterium sp. CFS15]
MKSNILNILTNYGNKLFGIVSIYLFVPLYIKLLGVEAYGIISFYTVVLSIISLADLGLSSAVIKEFSTSSSEDYKYTVFKLIEKKYLIICGTLLLFLLLFSNIIAKYWLHSDKFSVEDLTKFVILISVGVIFQLSSSLYYGAIFGLGFQVKANIYQFFWTLIRLGFIVIILKYFSNNLYIYFLWQIICNIFYVLFLRFNVLLYFKTKIDVLVVIFLKLPKHILLYIGGMSLISIISSVNSQMDKILVSSFFSLKIFGYYNLASSLAQSPRLLGMPLATALFPVFSKMAADRDKKRLENVFKLSNYFLNVMIFVISLILYIYISEIFKLWLGNRIEVGFKDDMEFLARMLIIGTVFLSMQLLFYYTLLAFGKTKYTIYQGICQIILGIPLLYFCIYKFGFSGAGYSWVIINVGAYFYLFFPLKKLIDIGIISFFINYTFVPFLICLMMFLCSYTIYTKYPNFSFIFYIILSSFFSVFFCVLYLFKLKNIPLKMSNFKIIISNIKN